MSPTPRSSPAPGDAALQAFPLFPLATVLFPDGLLDLRIFEARYLDMIAACLRNGTAFGVVALRSGGEVRQADQAVAFAPQGCAARLVQCDTEQTGMLKVRCVGSWRFELQGSAWQTSNGLWQARVMPMPDDTPVPPARDVEGAVEGLRRTLLALIDQGEAPVSGELRFDDAGWVANRWTELLPLPLSLKVQLLSLRDPAARLALVCGFLRRQGIIEG